MKNSNRRKITNRTKEEKKRKKTIEESKPKFTWQQQAQALGVAISTVNHRVTEMEKFILDVSNYLESVVRVLEDPDKKFDRETIKSEAKKLLAELKVEHELDMKKRQEQNANKEQDNGTTEQRFEDESVSEKTGKEDSNSESKNPK